MSEALLEEQTTSSTPSRAAALGCAFTRMEEWIDSSPAQAFLALTVLYFVVVFSLSSVKLLWLDELITLHIARLGSASAIWQALAQGADPNPPLTPLLVHLCRRLMGEHEFALRLPAAIGYWVGLLSIFLYLRRRLSATWALGGTVLSMAMAAFNYSFESRSYAIFYGFTLLAFFCWTQCVDSMRPLSHRRLFLLGMVIALASAISTNYFAVLAFLPIAAGEFIRTLRSFHASRQRPAAAKPLALLHSIDLWVWVGLCIAAAPLLLYRSMIVHSIAEFAPYAWNKVSLDQVFDSYTEMVEIVLYPILALFAFAIFTLFAGRFIRSLCFTCQSAIHPRWFATLVTQEHTRPAVPMDEAIAILFFMAYPFLGYLVATIHGGMLSPRFVIPVCFGFAVAATFVSIRLFGSLPRAGVVFLGFFLLWFLARSSVVGYGYEEQKQCFYKVLDHLQEAELAVPPRAPIVIPDPLMALTFEHYAPSALAKRAVFPIDFAAIRFYRHDDSPEQNIWAGRNSLYTLRVVSFAALQRSSGKYLIVATDGNWMIEELRQDRYPVERLSINTRAADIRGFTPLMHGTPVFFTAAGDQAPDNTEPNTVPLPYPISDKLSHAESANDR